MAKPKTFSNKDIVDYYDQTEVHYRMFWKLSRSLGLHYGIWEKGIRNLPAAILNTNHRLASLGKLDKGAQVLDAGCGIGGSSIYLAQQFSCQVHGISLSEKQIESAQKMVQEKGMAQHVQFSVQDYTKTDFQDASYDVIWAIESMETASEKEAFFTEAQRLLKPGGLLLIADVFKPKSYPITKEALMQKWLNAWAMSDILSLEELRGIAKKVGFSVANHTDVTKAIWPSVWRIYIAGLLGFLGTKWYNLFHNASYFSKIHYTSGINQYKTYRKGLWEYHLWCLKKE